MTCDSYSASLNLPGGYPARFQSLKPIFAEGQSGTLKGLTSHPAPMLFAVFDFLWHKHD
jgi:hypothetical protein